jgi:hypothetical protein
MRRGRAGRLPSTARARHASVALLVALAALPAPARGEPWAATDAADLPPRILAVDETRVVVLTPSALYRFQPESEAWTTLTEQNGLPASPLASLTLSAGQLWIGGTGVSFSAPQVDAWRRYAPGEGYPGRRVRGVEADEDYAYAATDSGAARLDRYVLEWEALAGPGGTPLGPVADLAVGTDRVWFALSDGVAQFRTSTEAIRVDSLLGQLRAPAVLALRQTGRYLWAITGAGVARYDKDLETWTSYAPGVDLPDARVHQATLQGEDLYLGTDAGLWHYQASSGIWRRDDRTDAMPGAAVLAFSLDNGLWVASDRAYASYDDAGARWIDFSPTVPMPPGETRAMAWAGGSLLLVGLDRIVYAARPPGGNPSLLICHEHPILREVAIAARAGERWRPVLDDAGLGLRRSAEEFVGIKGGATLYVNSVDTPGESDFANLVTDTRFDLALNGRLRGDRTLSGLYDSTDPDNPSYWIDGRGNRTDLIREVAAGEIPHAFFNTDLVPGAGLRGGRARVETGVRSETTRRRQLTVDGWAGERRTFSGRKVFYGHEDLYRLGYRNLVRESERIRVDRQVLKLEQDYSIDWVNGNFVLGDHVLLDDDTPVEVTFEYEVVDETASAPDLPPDRALYAAQAGWAASDLLFLAAQGQRHWDESGRGTTTTDLNARLEHRSRDTFLRVIPEIGVSWTDSLDPSSGATAAGYEDQRGTATGIDLRGRYRGLEITAVHRALGDDFSSLTDRRTLLGRLREESAASARLDVGTHWQGTLDWNQTLSDRVGAASDSGGALADSGGRGRESLVMGGVRFLNAGLPNLGVRYGTVRQDSLGTAREKRIARGELEIAPDAAALRGLAIKRLWLRAFFQRSDRQPEAREGAEEGERLLTDHVFVRLNGSAGTPLSWNLGLEDRWTYVPVPDGPRGRHREQEVIATIKSQPHPIFDIFLDGEASRDLAWRASGGPDGFRVDRRFNGNAHLYPGRAVRALVPLTLRLDLGRAGYEAGEPGEELPGGGSFWSPWSGASERQKQSQAALESWLQLLPRLRLVDRLERNRSEFSRHASTDRSTRDVFENRFEIQPEAGLVNVRLRLERTTADSAGPVPPTVLKRVRQLTTEWSQTWGGGLGSYVTAEAKRTQEESPPALHYWRTQGRLTYRRNRWRMDASLGATGTIVESIDPRTGELRTDQGLKLDTTWSVQPLAIFIVKLIYDVAWLEGRHPNHGIDLRLLLRV